MKGEEREAAPHTEEGLQSVLRQLEAARESGDEAEVGYALLELAVLVKWVRSDNSQDPFSRSHTLALDALEIFRRLGDKGGQVSALMLAAPFEPRESGRKMLAEAEQLAGESGNDSELARVLAARSREAALYDQPQAKALNLRALEIFRRLGDAKRTAHCLFSLAVLNGTKAEKRAHALEAAALFRGAGEPKEAARSVTVALMQAEEDLASLEPQALQALADAQAAGAGSLEQSLYGYLAKIAEAKGDADGAARYRRWEKDLIDSDGLSPLERWQEEVATVRAMIEMAKQRDVPETVQSFEEELRRLEDAKP